MLLAGLPGAEGIETARPVPDVLAEALTADLRGILGAEGADGLAGLSLIHERIEPSATILVYGRSLRTDPGGGGTVSPLIVGFAYPPILGADARHYRACVLDGIRVALPGDVSDADADAARKAVLERIDRVIAENRDCAGMTSIRLNVLQRDNGDHDVFVEGIRADVPGPGRALPNEPARAHGNSQTAGAAAKETATSTDYYFGVGDDYSVELDIAAFQALGDTKRSDTLRAVIEHLDGLSVTPTFVRLDCADAGQGCTVLTGQWPGGGLLALELEPADSGRVVANSAVLTGLERSDAAQRAAVNLCQRDVRQGSGTVRSSPAGSPPSDRTTRRKTSCSLATMEDSAGLGRSNSSPRPRRTCGAPHSN